MRLYCLKAYYSLLFICCRYLARNYLAQALCSMGKYVEAYEILDIQLSTPPSSEDFNASFAYGARDWGVTGIGENSVRSELIAEVYRNTNRAVVLALLGKVTDAQIILQSVLSEFSTFSPAIRCLVYTLLRQGKKYEASLFLDDLNVSPVSAPVSSMVGTST